MPDGDEVDPVLDGEKVKPVPDGEKVKPVPEVSPMPDGKESGPMPHVIDGKEGELKPNGEQRVDCLTPFLNRIAYLEGRLEVREMK